MNILKTNVSDSFVIEEYKDGSGHGERTLYLTKLHDENYYRDFFYINGHHNGNDEYYFNRQIILRERGPSNNCYFYKSDLEDYLKRINSSKISLLNNFFTNGCRKLSFTINYYCDSQERSYIGTKDQLFDILRVLSKKNDTKVCIEKKLDGIRFYLEEGSLVY